MQFYKEEVKRDIKQWCKYGNLDGVETLDDLRDRLEDHRWNDSITGNASGSYYFKSYKAEEALAKSRAFFDGEMCEQLELFGKSWSDIIGRGAEVCDVWCRCLAVSALTDEELTELTGIGA